MCEATTFASSKEVPSNNIIIKEFESTALSWCIPDELRLAQGVVLSLMPLLSIPSINAHFFLLTLFLLILFSFFFLFRYCYYYSFVIFISPLLFLLQRFLSLFTRYFYYWHTFPICMPIIPLLTCSFFLQEF